MTLESDFRDFLDTRVQLLGEVLHDGYGQAVTAAPGSGASVLCHLDATRRRTHMKDGTQVWSAGRLWFDGGTSDPSLVTGAFLLLPDGTRAKILSVETTRDETGLPYATKVTYG